MLPAATWTEPARHGADRERAIALGIATILVLARSAPFALFEHIQFDSDQALFGLMAKHIAEGRAFPLFLYGRPYVLAVDAWLAAPWFLVAPASLLTLSISLALTNVAVAILLVIGLERWGALRPSLALVAAMFFVVPPPIMSGTFLANSGGNVAPFLYVSVLWFLRDRPFWFGSVFAVGFLHREFTMYAVPVLLAADLWNGRLFQPAVVRRWLCAAVAALATWEIVMALQPWADMMGPGTRGEMLRGFPASPLGNLAARAHVAPSEFGRHARDLVLVYLPRVLGAATYENHVAHLRPWLAWPLALAAALTVLRVIVLSWRRPRPGVTHAFAWYLVAVGALAAAAFASAYPITDDYARYGLLVLLVPVGITAVLLALERRAWVRATVVCGVAAWASVAAADHVRLTAKFASGKPSDLRVLSDALQARGIRVAYGPYWTAYAVTFISNERVTVGTDFALIDEYQRLARAEPALVNIREEPCPGGEQVARWYICRD